MKFLHAADIHLDSPLAGLLARDDLPNAVIHHCTRRAFAAMIDLAREEDVAFVVIAGDLYDGDWKDFSTGLFFAEQMRRLGRLCFLLRGNHDARSLITRRNQVAATATPSPIQAPITRFGRLPVRPSARSLNNSASNASGMADTSARPKESESRLLRPTVDEGA